MKSVICLFAFMAPLYAFAQKGDTRYFKIAGTEIGYFHKEDEKDVTASIVHKNFTLILPRENGAQVVGTTAGREEKFSCKECYSEGGRADMETYHYQLKDNLSFELIIIPETTILQCKRGGSEMMYRIAKLHKRYKLD